MEQLLHFTHDHMLSLVDLQPKHNNESSDDENEEKDEDENNFVAEDHHVGQCNMCKEQIYSFHSYYYHCKDCDYSLHKFCAELPTTLPNHPLHPGHNLTLAKGYQLTEPDFSSGSVWMCGVCNIKWDDYNIFNYHCSICEFNMDIKCATMSQQKMDHPSHPHQLQRMLKQLLSHCNACGSEHKGIFYHCIICSGFWIHLECALMPSKLLIQQPTNGTFTHHHPLTLAYSFPHIDKKAKFYPRCRVCDIGFFIYLWLYKCDKCQYYVHIGCATSNYINLLRPGLGRTNKNFKDDDHPNLLHCPFPDESYSLLKHHFFNQKDFIFKENPGKVLNHFSHQHSLILLDMQTSLGNKSVFLHNPMKKIQLLCNGCVKPITTLPFYKCAQDTPKCDFVLHEWCARLPLEVYDHPGHRKHTLVLLKVPRYFFGVFYCDICWLPSNGFAYGCKLCNYYVDIHCACLPKEITHEKHASHLLSIANTSNFSKRKTCDACLFLIDYYSIAYHCPSCDFYLDVGCALSLPKIIRHKYDKHPLSLRYHPVENHPGDYFCGICEDQVDTRKWFYHCTFCAESMHTACAPLILGCEQASLSKYKRPVFRFVNVKFGGTLKTTWHPHLLTFVQGIESHGRCKECDEELHYDMTFKCLECEYACHYRCLII